MTDIRDKFGISGFDGGNYGYRVQYDDGDGVPTPSDTFIDAQTGQQVAYSEDVAKSLYRFYTDRGAQVVPRSGEQQVYFENRILFRGFRSPMPNDPTCAAVKEKSGIFYRCAANESESWALQLAQIPGLLPPNFSGNLDGKEGEKIAYAVAAHVAYLPPEQGAQFVEFLKTHPSIPLSALQAMERTAKARGNVELGHAIHQLFLARGPDATYIRLPYADLTGDPIYVERGGATERTWQQALIVLPRDQHEKFAQAIGSFISVTIADDLHGELPEGPARVLAVAAPGLYAMGVPLPPRVVIGINIKGSAEADGSLHPIEHTLSLQANVRQPITLIHEVGHFVDALRRARQAKEPVDAHGAPIFPSDHCVTLDSVSTYGGRCDAQRGSGHKAEEDFAETFAFAAASRWSPDGKVEWPKHLDDVGVKACAERVTKVLPKQPRALKPAEREEIARWADAMYRPFAGSSVTPPPRFEGNDQAYVSAVRQWMQMIQTEAIPAALQLREQKIAWMQQFLSYLAPQPGAAARPNIGKGPWTFTQ